MKYEPGMYLLWVPDNKQEYRGLVTVTEIRSRGQAKLSNGWVVDKNGIAEGNSRVSGGKVVQP